MNFVNKNTYNFSYLLPKSIRKWITLHDEVYAKYSLAGMYRIPNWKMYYKRLDRFFSETYRDVSIHFHFSLSFKETTQKKDFSFLFLSRDNDFKENLHTMILKSGEVSGVNNSHIVGKSLHKEGTHAEFVDGVASRTPFQRRESDTLYPASVLLKPHVNADSQSNMVDASKRHQGTHAEFVDGVASRTPFQRRESDTLYPASVLLKPHSNADRQSNMVDSDARHQRIKPTTDNKVHGVDTRATTSFPVWGLPPSGRTITIAQESSITSVVDTQSPTLKETASNSHNNVFTSVRILLDQGWQTRMRTIATTLTTISERQVETPTVGIPQSVHLTGDTQPTLREWTAPIIKQNLLEVTRDTTVHSHTARITNATHPFTVICRVGRMEPPQLSYAFAQPMRPIAQDEQAVVKVHEKEIVKVVQKEVQSLMASGSIVHRLSRADYAHIASNVYSSLARQLVVDRERLGI